MNKIMASLAAVVLLLVGGFAVSRILKNPIKMFSPVGAPAEKVVDPNSDSAKLDRIEKTTAIILGNQKFIYEAITANSPNGIKK